MKCFSARRLLLLVLLLAVAMPVQLQAKKLFRKAAKKQLKHTLVEICDWIEAQATEDSESCRVDFSRVDSRPAGRLRFGGKAETFPECSVGVG